MMLSDLNQEFQDLIDCFTSQNVDFLIVGSHALAFHGVARYTDDFDVWIRREPANISQVKTALAAFGYPILDADESQLCLDRYALRLGEPPRQIDIWTFLDGCEYDVASSRAVDETLGGTSIRNLGLDDYVATKRAYDRPKDHLDLALLRSMIGLLPGDPPDTPIRS